MARFVVKNEMRWATASLRIRALVASWGSSYGHLIDRPAESAPLDRGGFLALLAAIPESDRALADWAHVQTEFWAETGAAPAWLTAEEKGTAAGVIEQLLAHYPDATISQLLWTLAADAFAPRRRGRKGKWSDVEGRELVQLVETGLRATGLKRDKRKGLGQVIALIRATWPDRYAGYSEERLRKAYYEARRAQSEKSRKLRTRISLRRT